MIYLVTYAYFNEPHTVECELRDDGKFWYNDTVIIEDDIILHKEKKRPVINLTIEQPNEIVNELIKNKP